MLMSTRAAWVSRGMLILSVVVLAIFMAVHDPAPGDSSVGDPRAFPIDAFFVLAALYIGPIWFLTSTEPRDPERLERERRRRRGRLARRLTKVDPNPQPRPRIPSEPRELSATKTAPVGPGGILARVTMVLITILFAISALHPEARSLARQFPGALVMLVWVLPFTLILLFDRPVSRPRRSHRTRTRFQERVRNYRVPNPESPWMEES